MKSIFQHIPHLALIVIILSFVSSDILAQSGRLQKLTPSFILNKGQAEIKVFENLYTQTKFFDQTGTKLDAGSRATYNSVFMQTLFGTKRNLNWGIDGILKSVYIDTPDGSPLKALSFPGSTNMTRTALTKLGPRIKAALGADDSGLSFQSTLFFPTASALQGGPNGPYLDHDGYFWWTQFFYDRKLADKLQFFGIVDVMAQVDRKFDANNSSVATPVKAFFTHFPTSWFSYYVMSDFTPFYGTNEIISSYFWQPGIGIKFQLTSAFELEFLYTGFLAGKTSGAGKTFNIGLRFVK